jgi:hypothetical protein
VLRPHLRRAVPPILGVLLLALATAAGSTAASSLVVFMTPSGNIGCQYLSASAGQPASLRCDIKSGLVPKPARPHNCPLAYGDSIGMNRTGKPYLVCHGDTVFEPRERVLGYGTSWSGGGFTCKSETTGLTCTNQNGHRFFLSRQSWRVS